MTDEIMWCFTHHSQVVWVRDQLGLRSWCAVGDDIDGEDECSTGGARVVPRSDDRSGVQRYGTKGAFTFAGVSPGRTSRQKGNRP